MTESVLDDLKDAHQPRKLPINLEKGISRQIQEAMYEKNLQDSLAWQDLLLELISERRLQFIVRAKEARQKKLRWWTRITLATALLRIICYSIIVVVLLYFRHSQVGDLLNSGWMTATNQDLFSFLIFDGILAMTVLCAFAFLMENFLIFVNYSQQPESTGYIFAGCQVFNFLIIFLGCFCAGASNNTGEIAAHIFGKHVRLYDSAYLRNHIYIHQERQECCGGNGPSDWLHSRFFEFNDPAVDVTYYIKNSMVWLHRCLAPSSTRTETKYCSVPTSCCVPSKRQECGGHAQRKDLYEMMMAARRDDEAKMSQLEPQFALVPSAIRTRGCVEVLQKQMTTDLLVVSIMIFLLCLLSVIMTLLIVAVIIYHSSIGSIDRQNYIVDPATGNPLVRFFMWLDGETTPDDATLTDFSIIEELKKFDIDDHFGEDSDEKHYAEGAKANG